MADTELLALTLVNDSGSLELHLSVLEDTGLTCCGETGVDTDVWTEIAFVYDLSAGRVRWWKNGTLVSETTGLTPAASACTKLSIGVWESGATVSAIFDDLGIGGLRPTATYPLVVRSDTNVKASPP